MVVITAAMVKELRARTGVGMMTCKKALNEAGGDLEIAIDVLRKAGAATAEKRAGKTAAEGVIMIAVSEDRKQACMLELNCETDFVARDATFNSFARRIAERGLEAAAQDVQTTLTLAIDPKFQESIDEARKSLIGKMGENIQLRRVSFLSADALVGHYCHGQRIGVLVAINQQDPELGKDIAMHIVASHPLAVTADDVPTEFIAREKEIFLAQAQSSGKPSNIIDKMVVGRLSKFLKEVSLKEQPFFKNPDLSVEQVLAAKNARVLSFIRYELGEGIEK